LRPDQTEPPLEGDGQRAEHEETDAGHAADAKSVATPTRKRRRRDVTGLVALFNLLSL
jgi:hypothetical protein